MPALYLQGNTVSSQWTIDWPGFAIPTKTFPWWVDRISNKLFSGNYDLRPGLGCNSSLPVSVDIDIGDPMNILKISGKSYIPTLSVPDGHCIYDGNFITGQIKVAQNGTIEGGKFIGMAVSNEGAINNGTFSSGCVVDVIGTMSKATLVDSKMNIFTDASIGSYIGRGVKISGGFTGNNSGTIVYLADIGATSGSVINNHNVIQYALCPSPNVSIVNVLDYIGSPVINDGYYGGLISNGGSINGGVFKGGIINKLYINDCLGNSGVCDSYSYLRNGVFVGPWTVLHPTAYIINGYFPNVVTMKGGGSVFNGIFHTITGGGTNSSIQNVVADYILVSGKNSLSTSCVRFGCNVISGTISHGNAIFGKTSIGVSDSYFGPLPGYVAKETPSQSPTRFFGDVAVYSSGIMSGGHIMGGDITNEGVVNTGVVLFGYNRLLTGDPFHLNKVFQPSYPFSSQPIHL